MPVPLSIKIKEPRFHHHETPQGSFGLFSLIRLLRRCNMAGLVMMIMIIIPQTAKADLDLESCVGAWLETREWVNSLSVPRETISTAIIENASAACVILRHRGRTVGIGISNLDETDQDDQPLVQIAARQAIEAASQDKTIKALPDSVRKNAGSHLVMELEIAGPLQALLGRSIQVAAERLQPGVHGIAMRYEDKWWFEFPSQLRMSNTAAGPQRILALALASKLTPKQIEELRSRGAVSLYRFETVDLAQAKASDMPRMLISGDIPVIQSEVTPERVVQARDALARHVLDRIFTTSNGTQLVGSYTPLAASFKTQPPTDRERAIVAMALAKYAKSPGADSTLASKAEAAARSLLDTTSSDSEMSKADDPLEASAWYIAASNLDIPDDGTRITTIRDYVTAMNDADDLSLRKKSSSLVFACAALVNSPSVDDRKVAVEVARRARDTMPIQQHVTLMPWLGWVERENRKYLEADSSNPDLTALRIVRDQIMDLQSPPSPVKRTLSEGGYQLEPGPRGITSRSFRPALFIAESISDPAYIDEKSEAALEAHLKLLRYLIQLSCREDVAGTWRQPDRVIGGIRESSWDSELDPVTQAMGLMVLSAPFTSTEPSSR